METKHFAFIGVTSLLLISGIALMSRKQKKKKEAASESFTDELERNIEPSKIDSALLSEAFSPTYWKSDKSKQSNAKPIISKEIALEIAKQIYGAWDAGLFWDDLEDEVYRAFSDYRLKTFADVSRVANEYGSKEVAGKDLWKHLNSKLSSSEFAQVKKIVIQKIAT